MSNKNTPLKFSQITEALWGVALKSSVHSGEETVNFGGIVKTLYP